MLSETYTKSLSDRDFQSVLTAVCALSVATAGDGMAVSVADLRFRLMTEAFERGFSHEKVEALRSLGVKAQHKAYMMD